MERRQPQSRRNLGRKFGATLLSAGILLGSAENHGSALVDYSLPAFDYSWPESENGEVIAKINYDPNAWGYFIEDNGLPQSYLTAFNTALVNNVVSANIREGDVRDITIRKAQSDNGQWDYRVSEMKLFVSSGHIPIENRLYFDTRALKAVVVHESTHANSDEWYQYIRPGIDTPLPPPDIARGIDDLQQAEDKVFDIYYSHVPAPCEPSPGGAQTHCSMEQLQTYADETFHCIDEGHALQDLLDTKNPLPIGHPFNGMYEAAASIITSIEMNPSYSPDCLDANPSEFTSALRVFTKKILNLMFKTSPELEAALRRTSDRESAIDRLVA